MPKLESAADTKYQLQLPAVSFRVIDDDKTLLTPAGVSSEQIRHYGYNDGSHFARPDHYIRYIEPIESELAVQVEYDMDEQDKEWLDVVNAERKKEQSGPVSYEMFEIIMDKLEKEWFNLIKRIPQPASHMPVEDSRCAICDDGEGENSNAIVFCDGCNLAVHQDCYGVPYIPEGQWLCRKCTVSPENPVSCIFCPNEGGAFKQTTTGHWSHLLCAIWIPELTVGNAIYMEPVQDVEQLPKSRWKLNCSLCREKIGACIQCDNKACFSAFHVTCARQAGLLMTMKTLGTEGVLRAFCDKHLPAEMRDALDSDSDDSEFEDAPKFHQPKKSRRASNNRKVAVTTKMARAHAKSYRPGPPIVPQMIVNRLLDYVHKVALSKRQPFVERLCRYWSLKREARRGAPLLKRLHLEPWTASSEAKQQTEAEKAVKLKFLTMLRNDLDKVRMLAELTRKREREKLRQAQVIKDTVDSFLFPLDKLLRLTLEKISALDGKDLFTNPVNRVEVPDYYVVIKEPMCWSSIDAKLDSKKYRAVEEFKRDINLVFDNAMTYNPVGNPYHHYADKLKSKAKELLDQLIPLPGCSENSGDVGDVESARILLELLMGRASDEDDRDRLADLFAFELEKPKEPSPPPPPTPPPANTVRRDTYQDRQRRWEEKEAARKERVAQGRATRAGHARVEAFKHEAGLPSSSDNEVDTRAEASTSRRRTRMSTAGNAESSTNTSSSLQVPARADRTSASSGLSRSRSQVGVVRTEIVDRLSDKERREREKNMALTTDSVDDADQFARFNMGWILPEGSKRNRGTATQESAPPVPKPKRKRPVAAELSEITIESERPSTPTGPEAGPSSDRSIILNSNSPLTPNESTRDSSLSPPSDISTPAKRKSVGRPIPAPSPLKHSAARLSPRLSRSSSRRQITVEATGDEPPRKSARTSKGKEPEVIPERIDTTGEEEIAVENLMVDAEEEEMTPPPPSEILLGDELVVDSNDVDGSGVASEDDEEEVGERDFKLKPYINGELVWAKIQSFPYFPSAIVRLDLTNKEDIPSAVWALKPKAQAAADAADEELCLVQFFDKTNTYGWAPHSKLHLLGIDDETDKYYLSCKEEKSKGSTKWRKMVKMVKEAYDLSIDSASQANADP